MAFKGPFQPKAFYDSMIVGVFHTLNNRKPGTRALGRTSAIFYILPYFQDYVLVGAGRAQ